MSERKELKNIIIIIATFKVKCITTYIPRLYAMLRVDTHFHAMFPNGEPSTAEQ